MAYQPVKVKADDDGQRLDRWLKKHYPHTGFAAAQKAIRKGEIRIDGKRAKADSRLEKGNELRLPPIFHEKPKGGSVAQKKEKTHRLKKEDVDFIRSLVVYQDKDVIVLNKPSGLATQGGTGIKRHVDGLLDGLKQKDEDARPKLVHRLDKDTSGLLVLGKTPDSTRYLMEAFKSRDVKKIYLAVTMPAPRQAEGEIRAGLVKTEGGHERTIVDDESGKSARTAFKVLDKAGKEAALVAFSPLTGRTHQIRVHAADVLETPILGDFKYGFSKEALMDTPIEKGLHLHAHILEVPKPKGGMWQFSAPLPAHMKKTNEFFGFSYDIEALDGLL